MILALSLACLFQTVIEIIIVALVVALILWTIDYLGLPLPAIIAKLIVVLAVVICVWLLLACLSSGHTLYVP